MMRITVLVFATVSILLITPSQASLANTLRLTLLDGKIITVSGARKKPLYLKFWATWCGECRAQMPHLETTYIKHRDKIEVIGVNFGFNDTIELVTQFQREHKLTVPIAYDPLGQVAKSLNVTVVPYSILIDRKGKIVHKGFGTRGVKKVINKLIRGEL